ncbi:MAG: endonuclease/exonuclease/phosphatase family protein [Kofleriaceae bacterium]
MMFVTFTVVASGCLAVGDEDGDDFDDEGLANKNAAIRIIQHNIEKKDDVLDRTIQHAKNIDAHGIALQEVCPAQVARLRTMIPSSWSIGVGPGKKPAISGCDLPGGLHDNPANVVIWTGGKNGKVTDYPALGTPANAPGAMVCMEFERAKVPVHLCSAHLISADWVDPTTGTAHDGAAVRLEQTTKIKQIARDQWFGGSRNHFGIVAGDLNGQPSTPPLDKLYDGQLGGDGDFTEYNRKGGSREGENTAHADGSNTDDGQPYSRKIDYVLFSTNRAPVDGAGVNIVTDASDHDMVTSTVQMRK